jgi:acyl transferase domain-containing protein
LDGTTDIYDISTGATLGLTASVAMMTVIRSLGIEADYLLGHSSGEHGALLAAGAIALNSTEEVCDFIASVGLEERNLLADARGQAVLSVTGLARSLLSESFARHRNELFVSADNAPTQFVIAGSERAVRDAEQAIRGAPCLSVRLPFTMAYHTPLFEEWSHRMSELYASVPFSSCKIPTICCATAREYPECPSTIREMLAKQWSVPVRFREAIEALYGAGTRIFLEIGPNDRLTALVRDTLGQRKYLALSASSSLMDDYDALVQCCGQLFAAGLRIAWHKLDELC